MSCLQMIWSLSETTDRFKLEFQLELFQREAVDAAGELKRSSKIFKDLWRSLLEKSSRKDEVDDLIKLNLRS